MNDLAKNLLLWVVILVVLMSVFQGFSGGGSAKPELAYSDFLNQVKNGNVSDVVIQDQTITGKLQSGSAFTTISPETDNRSMIGTLIEHDVKFEGAVPRETPLLLQPRTTEEVARAQALGINLTNEKANVARRGAEQDAAAGGQCTGQRPGQ